MPSVAYAAGSRAELASRKHLLSGTGSILQMVSLRSATQYLHAENMEFLNTIYLPSAALKRNHWMLVKPPHLLKATPHHTPVGGTRPMRLAARQCNVLKSLCVYLAAKALTLYLVQEILQADSQHMHSTGSTDMCS